MTRLPILLFALLSFCFFSPINAQEIARKGSLGTQMENVPNDSGVIILHVFENSTASQINLKKGDVLKMLDGQVIQNTADVLAQIKDWRAKDKFSIKVSRNGLMLNLKGTVAGRPLETSEHGEVRYGSVDYDGGKLLSILEIPKGVSNPPVVFFLPGIGCGTLDFCYNPDATTKQLVEHLVSKGIAVYRVDKPGMGDGYGTKNCLEMGFNYEVEAFSTALKKLKTIEGLDTNKIFLYGHSLGAISAPLIAAKNDVAGIIAWGGIASSWFEYSLKMLRDQKVLRGVDHAEIESDFRKMLPFYYDFYVQKQKPSELMQNPNYEDFASNYFNGDLWHGMHHYSYFHELNEVDILTAYKNVNCPVLTLAGEFDLHAIDTDWAINIAATVNRYKPNTGTYYIVPQTTHHYHTVPSMKTYTELRSNNLMTGEYMSKHFNPDVPILVQSWIKEQS